MPKAESNGAPAAGENLVIHTYFAEFRHESRAMRAIEAALDAGIADRVETLAYLTDETAPHEQVSERFSIRRYAVDPKLPLPRILNRGLMWLIWTICTINGIRKRKPIMVQPHAVAAAGKFLDEVAGTSGGPLDAAARATWVKAYRELATAAEESVR